MEFKVTKIETDLTKSPPYSRYTLNCEGTEEEGQCYVDFNQHGTILHLSSNPFFTIDEWFEVGKFIQVYLGLNGEQAK